MSWATCRDRPFLQGLYNGPTYVITSHLINLVVWRERKLKNSYVAYACICTHCRAWKSEMRILSSSESQLISRRSCRGQLHPLRKHMRFRGKETYCLVLVCTEFLGGFESTSASPLPWPSRMGKEAALLTAICEVSILPLRVLQISRVTIRIIEKY